MSKRKLVNYQSQTIETFRLLPIGAPSSKGKTKDNKFQRVLWGDFNHDSLWYARLQGEGTGVFVEEALGNGYNRNDKDADRRWGLG